MINAYEGGTSVRKFSSTVTFSDTCLSRRPASRQKSDVDIALYKLVTDS
jgi:hypothetical protein